MMYYFELAEIDDMENPKIWRKVNNQKGKFNSPEEAVKFWKEKYGERLVLVYDENFNTCYENEDFEYESWQ